MMEVGEAQIAPVAVAEAPKPTTSAVETMPAVKKAAELAQINAADGGKAMLEKAAQPDKPLTAHEKATEEEARNREARYNKLVGNDAEKKKLLDQLAVHGYKQEEALELMDKMKAGKPLTDYEQTLLKKIGAEVVAQGGPPGLSNEEKVALAAELQKIQGSNEDRTRALAQYLAKRFNLNEQQAIAQAQLLMKELLPESLAGKLLTYGAMGAFLFFMTFIYPNLMSSGSEN